jgi:hypothetical protein
MDNGSMNTPSFSSQWQVRRRRRLLFAAVMLIVLLAATVFLVYARDTLRKNQIGAAFSQKEYQEALWAEEEARDVSRFNEKAQQLMQSAASHGVSPNFWAERRINLRQVQISRHEANELLLSVARTEGRLFSVEEFDISVTRDDEGLFNISNHPNTPLLLTVRGTALFRTGR